MKCKYYISVCKTVYLNRASEKFYLNVFYLFHSVTDTNEALTSWRPAASHFKHLTYFHVECVLWY